MSSTPVIVQDRIGSNTYFMPEKSRFHASGFNFARDLVKANEICSTRRDLQRRDRDREE